MDTLQHRQQILEHVHRILPLAPDEHGIEPADEIAAEAVAHGECERGIVFGGSGNGEAMAANKVHLVRCALCWNEETARLSRQHNDANVLSIGQRMIPEDLALKIVRVWLETPFEGGRHEKRVAQLNAM